jgi:selenide,water dikinase
LRYIPQRESDPNLLVGTDTQDDAGIYKLTDDLAMIQTVDFFTPIVDDPYMFGQIAAANSLSDVYAMGGQPKTVLNIVGFPIKKLGGDVLAEIMKGSADKVAESGAVIAGGHSIDDDEPKFGLSVTGIVHPDKFYKNVGAHPGDALVITKPIGVGIQTTAIKQEKLSEQQTETVSKTMAALNKVAAEALSDYHPNAVTDITGFGLLGHANEVASGSKVSIKLNASAVPVLEGTRKLAEEGVVPGGSKSNHRWLKEAVVYADSIDEVQQLILCDAVTSGGLLISLPKNEAESYVNMLHETGISDAAVIGQVTEKQDCCIYVD